MWKRLRRRTMAPSRPAVYPEQLGLLLISLLVIARNERRQRRGEEPLDVEAEVDRQMRDLGA